LHLRQVVLGVPGQRLSRPLQHVAGPVKGVTVRRRRRKVAAIPRDPVVPRLPPTVLPAFAMLAGQTLLLDGGRSIPRKAEGGD
jgi:hypothetical protein